MRKRAVRSVPAEKSILASHRVFSETKTALAKVGKVYAPNPAERFMRPQLNRLASDANAFLAFMPDKVDEAWLAKAPKLRIIAGALKGYDNLDLDACTRRGIWVSNVPDLLTIPTAELTIGLMIALARKIRAGDSWVRTHGVSRWRPGLYGVGIHGSTIGFLGLGMIGQAVAERLHAFGARLLYCDRRAAPAATARRLQLTRCDLGTLLTQCDYAIVAMPLNVESHHLLDGCALANCKKGMLLINPSRGSVVEEAAVLRALKTGQLGGYAADVFECEDLSVADHPARILPGLLHHPATLFTPHLGSAVERVRREIEMRAAGNIIDWAQGLAPCDALNLPNGVSS